MSTKKDFFFFFAEAKIFCLEFFWFYPLESKGFLGQMFLGCFIHLVGPNSKVNKTEM